MTTDDINPLDVTVTKVSKINQYINNHQLGFYSKLSQYHDTTGMHSHHI